MLLCIYFSPPPPLQLNSAITLNRLVESKQLIMVNAYDSITSLYLRAAQISILKHLINVEFIVIGIALAMRELMRVIKYEYITIVKNFHNYLSFIHVP